MANTQTLANVKTTANQKDNWINNAGSTTQVALEAQTFYDRTLLKRLTQNLVFAQFAQKGTIPKRGGNKINWRKFNSLTAATTPLTEGVTPSGNNLTMAQVEATLKQYGDFIEFSDVIDTVGIDPVLVQGAEVLGEQAGLTIDTVMREAFVVGTNVQYAGGKAGESAMTATDIITATEIRKIVRTLRKNNAKPFGKYYIGVIDPEIAYDLQNDADWKAVNQYNNGGEAIYDGEIGKLHGVKFIETTNLKVKTGQGTGDAIDLHCGLFFGQGAFGMADVAGMGATKPSIIVKPCGSAGTSDPLNQRSTEGWKTMFTATILDNLSVVRLECAVSE